MTMECEYDYISWLETPNPIFLTIGDIHNMRHGERADIVFFCRNTGDFVEDDDNVPRGVAVAPEVLFKRNYHLEFTKNGDGGINGTGRFYNVNARGEKVYHDAAGDGDNRNFEFHVEFARGSWYPFINGVLPARDDQGAFALLGYDKKWSEFNPDTLIGWRGKAAFCAKLVDEPHLYWNCL